MYEKIFVCSEYIKLYDLIEIIENTTSKEKHDTIKVLKKRNIVIKIELNLPFSSRLSIQFNPPWGSNAVHTSFRRTFSVDTHAAIGTKDSK